MPLVSTLYGMAPSEPSWTREETTRRLRLTLRRLVAIHCPDEVVRRIRAFAPPAHLAATHAEVLLLAQLTAPPAGRQQSAA